MNENQHVEPPQTIKEVGIHIGYMRQDITDMKKLMESLPNGFASKEEVASLDKRISAVEKTLNKNWIKMTGSGIVGALLLYLAQYALTHQ